MEIATVIGRNDDISKRKVQGIYRSGGPMQDLTILPKTYYRSDIVTKVLCC